MKQRDISSLFDEAYPKLARVKGNGLTDGNTQQITKKELQLLRQI
ncbi:hypothetical protein N8079_00720 [Crocinitomicaceae bacterium]|nr:hypothetical protein [Crocinitomicaceae bacterium]MDC1186330.1 hypothetical protein [Crocinitomicaceae bacterium]